MAKSSGGCSRTATVVESAEISADTAQNLIQTEVKKMTARVGAKAPDFTATAYHNGGFKSVTLSDFLGKWVVLCFYPGDFTFV